MVELYDAVMHRLETIPFDQIIHWVNLGFYLQKIAFPYHSLKESKHLKLTF